MNEQNLIPTTKLTESERRELARKGGQASARKRRFAKTFREAVEAAFSETRITKDGKEINGGEALVKSLLARGIKDDTAAAALFYKMSGQDIERMDINAEIGARRPVFKGLPDPEND